MSDQITFFASGNGDSVLLEAHKKTIMTDINYRVSTVKQGDEKDKDAPDFAPSIRKACASNHLDVFVLTHPDKDHLNGFEEIFHVGAPADWDENPEEGHAKILVDELWCSPYPTDPSRARETSQFMFDEIERRKSLLDSGDPAKDEDGNRLKVMHTAENETGQIVDGIEWNVLGPTEDEANIDKEDEDGNELSCNASSLVIQWRVTTGQRENCILLGGDATKAEWERINEDFLENTSENLQWDILLAPHHCSRYSLGDKDENGEFTFSDKAIETLSEQIGSGFIVASSKYIKRDQDDPPSWSAKQKYLRILANGADPADGDKKRFKCTGGEKEDGDVQHVSFKLTGSGPSFRTAMKAAPAIATSSTSQGGGFG